MADMSDASSEPTPEFEPGTTDTTLATVQSVPDTQCLEREVLLDRLCAAYPQLEREVLEVALSAHEYWMVEYGTQYDAAKLLADLKTYDGVDISVGSLVPQHQG